ncbi:MAG: lipoate--protein ligase family protein [Limisphaerales bacterium]
MIYLDQTCSTPKANLALDDWLLEQGEKGGGAWLRTWQPQMPFVVLGRGNQADREVNLEECERAEVPVLKRSSGGGAVLLGPGCLCYTVILPIESDSALAFAQSTNEWMLRRIGRAIGGGVTSAGDSDLVLNGRKVAGHAQRRKRRSVMFHGVLLLAFELDSFDRFLRFPSRVPAYRRGREHRDFVANLACSPARVADSLVQEWRAEPAESLVPESDFGQ